MKQRVVTNIGSVSSGTMLNEDLIPAFIDALRQQRPLHRTHRRLISEIEEGITKRGSTVYWDWEASDDVNSLMDALGDYAPSYFYFGACAGDGSDYGFWLSESWSEEFDGLTVSDLSEVPSDHYGEIAVINDHGNVSLYSRARNNRLVEVWAIV